MFIQKKIISIILCITMMFSMSTIVNAEENKEFSDIKSHWAENIINFNQDKSFVIGMPDGTFKPDDELKRSELITYLNRIFGLKKNEENHFIDVKGSEWYFSELDIAEYYGYINENTFCGESPATCLEVMNMIDNIVMIDRTNEYVPFNDLDGLIFDLNDANHNKTITRAEVLVIFDNILGYIVTDQSDVENIPSTGRVTVIAQNITIENKDIENLFVTPGVYTDLTIKDSEIEEIEIAAEGIDSDITLENVKSDTLKVFKRANNAIIKLSEQTEIGLLETGFDGVIKSDEKANVDDIIVYSGKPTFESITVNDDFIVNNGYITMINSEVDDMIIEGSSDIDLDKKTIIRELDIKAETTITGEGRIRKAEISAENVIIETVPSYYKVDRNITSVIGGDAVTYKNDKPKKNKSILSSVVNVTGVELDTATAAINVGGTTTLTAIVSPNDAANKEVKWTSSDTNIATVNEGIVTGKGVGTATITVTTLDENKTDTCTVTVNAAVVNVTGVELDTTTAAINVGGTTTLTAIVSPNDATNKEVKWTSSDTNIATVNKGIVTGKGVGTATITVTTLDRNKTDTCTVTVNAAVVNVTGVELDTTTAAINVGGTTTLTATVSPNDATNKEVKWTSSDTNIATVNKGIVTGKGVGTATITVTTLDGNKTDTCTVTVVKVTKVSTIEDLVNIGTGATNDKSNIWGMDDEYILTRDLDFTNDDSYSNPNAQDIIDIDDDGNVTETLKNALLSNDNGKGFISIGDSSNPFTGIFLGNGKTISNLYIKRSSTDNVGLFGYIDGATINNLGLLNVSVTGKIRVGGLIGRNYNSSTVSNCYSTGNINGEGLLGGLIGSNDKNSIISDSYSTGNVNGIFYLGGLVGHNSESEILKCYATGDVTTDSTNSGSQVGGLLGINESATVLNSYATGNVTGSNDIGGLIGANIKASKVSYSYSKGAVTGNGTLGGLVGENREGSEVLNSIAFNDNIKDDTVGINISGVVVGHYYAATVNNCYARVGLDVVIHDSLPLNEVDRVTAEEFKLLSFYNTDANWHLNNAWDFNNIWEIKTDANRPTLKGVGDDNGK